LTRFCIFLDLNNYIEEDEYEDSGESPIIDFNDVLATRRIEITEIEAAQANGELHGNFFFYMSSFFMSLLTFTVDQGPDGVKFYTIIPKKRGACLLQGFVAATSSNLPRIDIYMFLAFFSRLKWSPELKHFKTMR
jgi:hypothetical protein